MSERDRSQGMLKQAILALQAGRTKEARQLLATLVRQNPHDVTAWVWLGKAMDDPAKRRDCFTQALQLDPDNEEARRGMVALLSGPTAAGEATLSTSEEPSETEAVLAEEDELTAGPQEISAFSSPCPNCGAQMRYDVGRRALHCAHCGTDHAIPEPTTIVEWLGMPPDLSGADAQGELVRRETLRCRSCGATTAFSSRAASLSCPYCGSPQVVRSKGRVYLVPPRALIPFDVDAEGAKAALYEWLEQGYWHPDRLDEEAQVLELYAAYLPFWGFKGIAEVTFQLQGSSSAFHRMRSMPGQQKHHITVQDLLIPGSLSIDEDMQEQIEPFDLDQAVPFRPEYLSGWPAEVYQVALADAAVKARGRMTKEARSKAGGLEEVLNASAATAAFGAFTPLVGGKTKRARDASYVPKMTTIRLDSFMHYVLPVWVGTYRFRGRTYAFAVNGQTGKAGGEAPRGGTLGILTIVMGVVIVALIGIIVWRAWPAIVDFFSFSDTSSPPPTTVAEAERQLLPYLGLFISATVVTIIFGVAARWQRIKSWFRKKDE